MPIALDQVVKRAGEIGLIAGLVGVVLIGVSVEADREMAGALDTYRAKAHDDAEMATRSISTSFNQMYQNLRTISLLASVRKIDRHGESLSADGRQSIQQIYNNLASNIDVSEVYIVPSDLDPELVDPQTKEKQAPILMFDKVRLGIDAAEPEDPVDPAAPVQEEIFEYRALKNQMAMLSTAASTLQSAKSSDIRFYSIPSVITCDNSVYVKSRNDADRTGPIYSVPFYGENNQLKGTITAVMLNSAVSRLLPDRDYALIDITNGTVFNATQGGQQIASAPAVSARRADSGLFYSEVLPVQLDQPNKIFELWSGRPRREFLESDAVKAIDRFVFGGRLAAAAVGLVALAIWTMIRRAMRKATEQTRLQTRLAERIAEVHALEVEQAAAREAATEDRRRADATQAALAVAATAEQNRVVDALAAGLDRLAGGDLVVRIDEPFPAAYEKLRADFNRAMAKLHAAMDKVAAAVQTIRAGGVTVSEAAGDLSRRTEQQAAGLEQTSAALEEITVTVAKTAMGSGHARDVIGSVSQRVERSGQVMRDAVSAMSGIEASSGQIGQIVGVIDEIAFQTNLLALNAAIEAARAGDAGRGFAVVAFEVRALAQRCSGAAKQIEALVRASTKQIEDGVDLVGRTGEALSGVITQMVEINVVISEIATSAREQSTALSEVTIGVNQIDQVTQRNAAMAEESTAACCDLARETEDLARLLAQFVLVRSGGAIDAESRQSRGQAPIAKQVGRSASDSVVQRGSWASSSSAGSR